MCIRDSFGMICRLPNNILHKHALNIFNSRTISAQSWFHQIRDLCVMYNLPHPLQLLNFPASKLKFKKMVKKCVINYWEQKLRAEAIPLPSLHFFNSNFMSLAKIHPMWSTAGCSPAKVAMATIQAQMVSGRYRTEYLCRHWSKNKAGVCLLSEGCKTVLDDLHHILLFCPALQPIRDKLVNFTISYCDRLPHQLGTAILTFLVPTHPLYCQFLVDCSPIAEVISLVQTYGRDSLTHLFHITRTWCYSLHRERLKMLGRWNFI